MYTRFGNILYSAGLIGAAASVVFTIDAIWVHQSGRSPLPGPARFVSREDMMVSIGIGVLTALLFWGSGSLARVLLRKPAAKRPAAK